MHGSFKKVFIVSYLRQFTWFAFNELEKNGVDKQIIENFKNNLNSLSFDLKGTAPTFDVSILNSKECFENFKKFVEEFKKQLI